MGYQHFYDQDGRYEGYSTDRTPTSIFDMPWWFPLAMLGVGILILFVVLPILVLIILWLFGVLL